MPAAAARACSPDGTAWSTNQAKMSPTADWPASYPNWPGRMPSSTTPHIPSTIAGRSPRTRWQVLVPMTATIRPGPVTVDAGTDTCASTFATATAVPGRSPVHDAASAVSEPARLPIGRDPAGHLVVDHAREARIERAEVGIAGEPVGLRPDRLVARRAAVAGLDAGQLPDDPVGGLDQAVGGA